jgi:hypothetical protein
MAQTHVIKKQIVELKTREKDMAQSVFALVSNLFSSDVPRIYEDVFDAYTSVESIILCDKLEVDLGHISSQSFEHDFKRELRKRLIHVMEKIGSGKEYQTTVRKTDRKSVLHYFLKFGAYPWWVSQKPPLSVSELIQEIIEEEPEAFTSILRLEKHDRVVFRRLAYQIRDEKVFHSILKTIQPSVHVIAEFFIICRRLPGLHVTESQIYESLLMHSACAGKILKSDQDRTHRLNFLQNIIFDIAEVSTVPSDTLVNSIVQYAESNPVFKQNKYAELVWDCTMLLVRFKDIPKAASSLLMNPEITNEDVTRTTASDELLSSEESATRYTGDARLNVKKDVNHEEKGDGTDWLSDTLTELRIGKENVISVRNQTVVNKQNHMSAQRQTPTQIQNESTFSENAKPMQEDTERSHSIIIKQADSADVASKLNGRTDDTQSARQMVEERNRNDSSRPAVSVSRVHTINGDSKTENRDMKSETVTETAKENDTSVTVMNFFTHTQCSAVAPIKNEDYSESGILRDRGIDIKKYEGTTAINKSEPESASKPEPEIKYEPESESENKTKVRIRTNNVFVPFRKDVHTGQSEYEFELPLVQHNPSENNNELIVPDTEYYVSNAGLILLWPFFSPFFNALGLLTEMKLPEEHKTKAIFLLNYLCWETECAEEYTLVLNKILCGWDVIKPLPNICELTEREKTECPEVIRSAIQHWGTLGNTSVEGFRSSFIVRDGILYKKEKTWFLKVERVAFDILLEQLNWNIQMIKCSWMDRMLQVEW